MHQKILLDLKHIIISDQNIEIQIISAQNYMSPISLSFILKLFQQYPNETIFLVS